MNKHKNMVITVTFVGKKKKNSKKKWDIKNIYKPITSICFGFRRYKNFRHILQNTKVPKNVMGFIYHTKNYWA